MRNRIVVGLIGSLIIVAAALVVGCGGSSGAPPVRSSPGTVFAFGTDAPNCDVESFIVTITSASLIPTNGGTAAPLITATNPVTVDFARLSDFTNILSTANITNSGSYGQLQLTLTNPQMTVLNASVSPPVPVNVPVTLTSSTLTININPALAVSNSSTSGITLDFNLAQSVSLAGLVSATVKPQITVTANTPSGTTVGEATALYGTIQSVSTGAPANFNGTLSLAVDDGSGQTLTVLTTTSTVFEGDDVTSIANLTAGTFVEVNAIVNTSGQVVAQVIDSEEKVSATNQKSAILGKIVSVTQGGSGVTGFTLVVDDEIPSLSQTVPLESTLPVNLTGGTTFFANWQYLNKQNFAYGPKYIGVAQNVAVYGTLATTPLSPVLTATQIFLRPQTAAGNLTRIQQVGSDGVTGGFNLVPCSDIFGAQTLTVLTNSTTTLAGASSLTNLSTSLTLYSTGVLFYQPTPGESLTGVEWGANSWVMEARGVQQNPAP